MDKVKYIFLVFFGFNLLNVYAQFPSNDATWELKKEDQFNSYNSNDWYDMYPWGSTNNGGEYNYAQNLIYNNGWLKIKADTLIPPVTEHDSIYHYQAGAIESKFKFRYGYFESSIKTPIGQGYWPAYWLWSASHCSYYNEIDIHERGGDLSATSNKTTESHHWWTKCVHDTDYRDFKTNIYQGINNCANAHNYSVLWQPGRMSYYIDNSTIHSMNDQTNTPSHSMDLIINFAIDKWTKPIGATVFPAYYEIDFIKIYQLKTACSTSESICTFTKSSYDFKVKKDVTFGGTGCNTSVNTSDGVTFWAKDFIILDKNSTFNSNGSGYICFNTYDCSN